MATFQNPQNGYRQTVSKNSAFWWCLVFGCFYFAYKGVWKHFAIGLLAGMCTAGISWFVYPFFAYECVRNSYLERGWLEVRKKSASVKRPAPSGSRRPKPKGVGRTSGPSFDFLED